VFLTAFLAVVDTTTGRGRYANAGHPPAYLCREEGAVELGPTGPIVGLLDEVEWDTGQDDEW
jgi:serine phosphatase RsbU (regulator of sigma subunit)